MPVQFKKYDVIRVPSGNATFLILDNNVSGKALCLNDNTLRLLSDLSMEDDIEIIGHLSMFDVVKSPAPIILTMSELLVLMDCANGSLESDEDNFHYAQEDREDVRDKVSGRLDVIKLKVSDT